MEYKAGWNSESIVHTLSAFANDFHNLGEDSVAEENGVLRRIIRDALNYIKAQYLKEFVTKHPDRAEAERFWNFPYAAIEEAVMNAVSCRYRNRRIGELLKELGLIEGHSTGLSKMLEKIAHNGSPKPVFETDEDRTYFLVRLPVHEESG